MPSDRMTIYGSLELKHYRELLCLFQCLWSIDAEGSDRETNGLSED